MTTAKLPILDLHHLFFTAPDLDEAESWLIDALGATFYKKLGYYEVERRWGSFVRLGRVTVEPIQVDEIEPGQDPSPVQRFVSRLGYRWHSIAWFVEDVPKVKARLEGAGVRMFYAGGAAVERSGDMTAAPAGPVRAVFTYPPDSFVALEFVDAGSDGVGGDATGLEEADGPSPLGIDGLAWMTVLPRDRQAAVALFTQTLDAEIVWQGRDEFLGTDSTILQVGPTRVEFAEPIREDALLGDDRNRTNVLHSVTFRLESIAHARTQLESAGVPIVSADESHLIVAPPFAPDVRIGFTERSFL